MMTLENLLPLLAIGAVGGFLAGLLGLGGGTIFVPCLFFVFSQMAMADPMHAAVGTSMALVAITSSTSATLHHRRGAVDASMLKSWAPFVLLGVAAGISFSNAISGDLLKKVFGGVMLCMAIYMARSQEPKEAEEKLRLPAVAQRGVATVIGGIASLLGIGGGGLSVPALSYTGLSMRRAVGTGSAMSAAISIPSAVLYALTGPEGGDGFSIGHVNLVAVAIVAPGCLFLSPVGVKVSHALPRRKLKRVFAVVLAIVCMKMLLA